MVKRYDVFISYSRKDSSFADKVCKELDSVNISYFIDRTNIVGGDEYISLLKEAINNSQIILYLASTNSYDSFWTNKELAFAITVKKNKDIIPFIIDNSELPEDKLFMFADINICNIRDSSIKTIVESIHNKLSSNKGYDIYICAPRRDAWTSELLYTELTRNGFVCFGWRNLSYDIDAKSQIKSAIRNSKIVVLYISINDIYSTYAYKELEYAQSLGRTIIVCSEGDSYKKTIGLHSFVFNPDQIIYFPISSTPFDMKSENNIASDIRFGSLSIHESIENTIKMCNKYITPSSVVYYSNRPDSIFKRIISIFQIWKK